MAVTFSNTNKPLNPRGNDASPLAYNRAALYSGKALDFDGVNDYVQCDNLDTLYSSDFTISYFFKWESTGDNWGTTQGSAGTNLALLTGKDGSGVIRFAFWGNDLDAPASLTPAQNEWSFLSFTYNRTTKERKIYINGILAAEDVSASNPNPTANNFQISAFTAISGYYNNQVSNVKVFSTALTPAQIADLYNNPEKIVPTGLESNLKLWLPMMEGAGTTAYDGSGNGNHGTISGATYVNGVGAPVAQTSVIDWNKNNNDLTYSQDFSQSDWNKPNLTITANQADPIGGTNAFLVENNSIGGNYIYQNTVPAGCFSVYAKAGNRSNFSIISGSYGNGAYFDLAAETSASYGTGSLSVISSAGNDWYRCSVYINTGADFLITLSDISGALDNVGDNMYFAFCQIENGTSVGPYVPTFATNQTTPVLLPAGLTTGRDITGVNLFENVRKQGALNLDGSSWAEVHDNESVDVQSFTLECWVNLEFTGTYQEFISKGDSSSDRTFELYLNSTENRFGLLINTAGFVFATQTINENQWYHVVASYDSTNDAIKGYVNSVEKLSTTGSVNPNNTDGDVVIGAWFDKSQLKTNGQIAQPRIYNRALTASEVLRNYNSGKNTYTNS